MGGGQLRCIFMGEACSWRRLKHAKVRVRAYHNSDCIKVFDFGFPDAYHKGLPNRTKHSMIGQLVSEIRAQSRAVLEETVRSGCTDGSQIGKNGALTSSQVATTSWFDDQKMLLLAGVVVVAIAYFIYRWNSSKQTEALDGSGPPDGHE